MEKINSVITLQHKIDKVARARLKGQKPFVIWFTGISGAGKTTLANLLEKSLHQRGYHIYLLDGDNIRQGLNKDLGFSDEGRRENIRRAAQVARLMVDAGLIVIAAFISPFQKDRDLVRELFAEDEFIEVYVDASTEVAQARGPKSLYKMTRLGAIKSFTGIDSIYIPPIYPDIWIKTAEQ
jgi:adenylyl-sulfate kinase